MMRLKVLAAAALVGGGLGLASTANAAPLAPAPAETLAGDAAVTNVWYGGPRWGYGGYYRPRPFYRPYGYGYGGYYRPRPFYRPYYGYRRPFYY